MPTPARTSLTLIVAAGRRILETDGIDGLTMQRVADEVGVREPSLYKRVHGRADLLRLIANDVARELGEAADAAADTGDPGRDLAAMAAAYRAFAHTRPQAYGLLFVRLPERARVDPERNAVASATLLRAVASLASPDHALEAARTIVAWLHGFVSMELAGSFRLGGDVDAAFAFGVERVVAAIAAAPSARAKPSG